MTANAFPLRPDVLTILTKDPTKGTTQIKALAFDDQGASMFIRPDTAYVVGGTWTFTRNAQGDVSLNKTAAADTTYLYIPLRAFIKPTMQTEGMYNQLQAADRGFKIKSVNVVYSIGTLALTSSTPTINKIVYSNNVANAVTQPLAFTGSLATATQANPYVSTLTITTPVYDQTAASDYNLEVAIVAQATSVFKFYGAFVNYTQNSF